MHKTTVLEHALLAFDTYKEKTLFPMSQKSDGWMQLTNDSEMYLSFHQDMFTRSYLHKTSNRVDAAVIAYRGTLPTDGGNLLDDYEIARSEIPEHAKLAEMYYAVMSHYIAHTYLIYPTLTGHSLGGAYAQITAINAHPDHPLTIVFNSPGVGQIAHQPHLANYDFIHNFNSVKGVINKDGKTLGSVTQLTVPEGSVAIDTLGDTAHQGIGLDLFNLAHEGVIEEAVSAYGIYEQHRIQNLIQALQKQPAVSSQTFF